MFQHFKYRQKVRVLQVFPRRIPGLQEILEARIGEIAEIGDLHPQPPVYDVVFPDGWVAAFREEELEPLAEMPEILGNRSKGGKKGQ